MMITKPAFLDRIGEYRRLAGVDEIGRRALANNAFDGILTMIGVLMGSFFSGITEPRIVLSTGMATGMAMGISGAWGAYMAESAERERSLKELEQAMLLDLADSKQARAGRFATIAVATIDGLSPLVSGLFTVLPFAFGSFFDDIKVMYIVSLLLGMTGLFGLGVFLARVARKKILSSGLQMILAGVVCVIMSYLLNVTS
jgi:predicted membrane protein (TIGR00267 family)